MENYNNTILLPHNQEAFQKVMEHFQSNKRAAVVHAKIKELKEKK